MDHAFSFKNSTRTQLRRFSLSTLLAFFLAPILAFAA